MLNIQLFHKSYLSDLTNLIHQTVKKCYPLIYPTEIVDFYLDYHCEASVLKRSAEGKIFLGFIGEKLIGTNFLVGNELGGLYIHPDFQKKGYGKAIVKHTIEYARKRQMQYIYLESTPLAKQMYLQLGFSIREERVAYVGEENIPLVYSRMEYRFA